MKIKIYIENSQDDMALNFDDISGIVSYTLKCLKVKAKALNIYFLDPDSISQLHLTFFGDSEITDCMSFPIEDFGRPPFSCDLLGEVVLSTRAAIDYARVHNNDPYDEILTYLVHGLLHLSGYDDTSIEEFKFMQSLQDKIVGSIILSGMSLK